MSPHSSVPASVCMSQSPWSTVITSVPTPDRTIRETSDSAWPSPLEGYAVAGAPAGVSRAAPKVCAPEIASRTARLIGLLPRHACARDASRRPSSSAPATLAWSTRPTTKAGCAPKSEVGAWLPIAVPCSGERAGQLAQQAVEPAGALGRAGGGVLDGLHGREVRPVGCGHAGGVHGGQRAGVPHRQQRGQGGVQPEHRVRCEQRGVGDRQARSRGVVDRVGVRDDEREAVGRATQREDHQHGAARRGQPGCAAAGDGVRRRAGARERRAERDGAAGEGGAEQCASAQGQPRLVVVGAAAGSGPRSGGDGRGRVGSSHVSTPGGRGSRGRRPAAAGSPTGRGRGCGRSSPGPCSRWRWSPSARGVCSRAGAAGRG